MRRILKILFSTKVIWCAVVLNVLCVIMGSIVYEFFNEESASKLYSFGQSYPLIKKCITPILKIIPPFCGLSVVYLEIATIFKLVTLFYDKKNAYFEKIKLLLYFKTTCIIAVVLSLANYALFLTLTLPERNTFWVIYFVCTFLVSALVNTSVPLVLFIGSLFCIFEIKKYWKEIKSFYFLPCLYPIFEIIYFVFVSTYFMNIFNYLSGKKEFLYQYSLLKTIIMIGIVFGILWLDYKRSAKNITNITTSNLNKDQTQ